MPAEIHEDLVTLKTQEDFIEEMKKQYKIKGWRIALLESEEGICLMNRGLYSVTYFDIKRKDIEDRQEIIKQAQEIGIDTDNLTFKFDEYGNIIKRPWLYVGE